MGRRKKKGHGGGGGGHGSGGDRWLVSYADFITLLFAFFVVMYAVSKVDTEKMEQVVAGIRGAMDMEGSGGEKSPLFEGSQGQYMLGQDQPGNPGKEGAATVMDKKLLKLKEEMEKDMSASVGRESKNDAVEFDVTERGIRIRLTAGYFFDVGSAALRPEAIPIVDGIAQVLQSRAELIRVEGHTDAQGSVDNMANWKLSSDRALSIVRYMIKGAKIDPKRLFLAAFAHYRPVTTNDTPEGRALNRRIDLFLLNPKEGVADSVKDKAKLVNKKSKIVNIKKVK